MSNRGFSEIPLPVEREPKPRNSAMTMMIDWALPLRYQADLVEMNGEFIDLAKIAVGLSGLLDRDKLRAKVGNYQENGIEPFPGGMFLEYAHHIGKEEEYWRGCAEAGYRLIEVSDNAIPLDADTKRRLIKEAAARDLRVLGEVGSKHTVTSADALIADVTQCLDAGAWKVFIEAAELVEDGKLRTDLVDRIRTELDADRLLWELPGSWISGTHECDVHDLAVYLLENLGPHTNIANVMPQWIAELETLRTRIGVRTLADEMPQHA
ncbi:phosphosulfolactate synthase [Amycolatopsis jejuensis]|uniref:phosphosulfolactate synthase n=1 Tax=Amycolatopsis jejuensis TaxID=330084 RepID=UPI000525702F|nr:phosphosulfolactate synthase [Amycolatopsis jejuensis]